MVHIPAKVDYAVRALLALAESQGQATVEELARAQELPTKFLGAIMNDLRRSGLVASRRGWEGGYRLAKGLVDITLMHVIVALDEPLVEVRGVAPENALYAGAARHLQDLWLAVGTRVRHMFEQVTLDDVLRGVVPGASGWGTKPVRRHRALDAAPSRR